MKKQLLTVIAAGISAVALSHKHLHLLLSGASFKIPMWPVVSGGVRYMDAVNPNVVWCTGYDGFAPGLAYNFFARTIDGGNTWNNGNVFADTNTYIISNIEGVNDTVAWVSAYMKAPQDRGVLYTIPLTEAQPGNSAATLVSLCFMQPDSHLPTWYVFLPQV
ncbi:MAG: hypothetical protein KatS3mg028_0387 [Bacteroidia bacterium]|nr:MAG: hypothetical protein KatS3mg028_0387 [Bacteroidia bacterium]